MPLPSSGAISISAVAAEFGGTAPHSLSEYYRGGGLVPDTPANADIPASGIIKLSDFYGGSSVVDTITLAPTYLLQAFNFSLPVFNSVSFESDGDMIHVSDNDGTVDIGDWINPKASAPGTYEIRATQISGDSIGGTMNTWLPLTTSRTWTLNKPTGLAGLLSGNMTIEIRQGVEILDSTEITLYSETVGGIGDPGGDQ